MSDNYILNISKINLLDNIATIIASKIDKGVIYLHGDLGVGKTTFVQLFIKKLGYSGNITSPSYGIINHYTVKNISILHADLYRLVEPTELLYLDVDEWTIMADLIFIEWPSHGGDFIPQADIDMYMSLSDGQRWLEIRANQPVLQNIFNGDGGIIEIS